MGPKKKPGQRGARGAGPGQQPPRSMPPGSSDPGIDIVFGKDDNKPKPVKKPKGHRQRCNTLGTSVSLPLIYLKSVFSRF